MTRWLVVTEKTERTAWLVEADTQEEAERLGGNAYARHCLEFETITESVLDCREIAIPSLTATHTPTVS